MHSVHEIKNHKQTLKNDCHNYCHYTHIHIHLHLEKYALNKLKYDFMGYQFQDTRQLSFHHLIVPARKGGAIARWNGAILCGGTSHEYLHRIEAIDYDIFSYITSEMVNMNIKGYLDKDNLKRIDDLLSCFEKEYSWLKTKKGKNLIKDEYRRRNKF